MATIHQVVDCFPRAQLSVSVVIGKDKDRCYRISDSPAVGRSTSLHMVVIGIPSGKWGVLWWICIIMSLCKRLSEE
jgi:hypothetical protein